MIKADNTNNTDGTVGKAFAILKEIADLGRPVRFSQLLAHSPHPKATLYRLLQTLTNLRMLSYDKQTQNYSLGMSLVQLAHAAWKQSSLAPIARPYIDTLGSQVNETIHLAQMNQGQVLYVDKRNARDPIEMFSQAGKIGPGYCTGIGKAIMAFMDDATQQLTLSQQSYLSYTPNTHRSAESLKQELIDIRHQGVAYDREEHETNIICIAVPILSGGNRVIGGLSITGSTTNCAMKDLQVHSPRLLEAAKNIGEAATNWRFPIQS